MTTIEQRFRFTVRAAFTRRVQLRARTANAPCLPIRPMTLRFSALVSREFAAQVRLRRRAGARSRRCSTRTTRRPSSARYVPEATRRERRFTIELPAGLKDNAGRTLANAASFPLKVATGDAPPIAKFAAAPFGVVERRRRRLPVTLRHVQGDLRPPAGAAPPHRITGRAARCA